MKDILIGIDLGTSTSEVAYLKEGKPCIIPNKEGNAITPSIIGIDDTEKWIIGQGAKDQLLAKPKETVMEVKRHMGETDKIQVGKESYLPQELSAKILAYLKECATDYLGEEVKRAVITVPAYFTNEQRKATVEAGEIAGLKVERILNEPTAAALAYGLEHMEDEAHVLVYDLGGGTLDVTLLESMAGILEVKASSGNNALGGKDFDQQLIDYMIDYFMEKEGIDLKGDIFALSRLKVEAEHCKKQLSTENSYEVNLPFMATKENKPVGLCLEITKEKFEELIKELIISSGKAIDCVLKDGKVSKEEIDVILLVGGSTRIPYVQQFIEEKIGKKPESLVEPDLAVVMGASIQGGIIDKVFDEETGIIITDVCPYTLGINVLDFLMGMVNEDGYSVIIPRNVTIPTTKSQIYATVGDNQTEVEIKVYQGDKHRASENHFLGEFKLTNIPPNKAGAEKIKVEFSYDINGILKVEAYILSTGEKAGIELTTTGVEMQPESETTIEEVDYNKWEDSPIAKDFRRSIKRAQKYLDTIEDRTKWNEGHEELEEKIKQLKTAIVLEDVELAEQMEDALLDVFYELED